MNLRELAPDLILYRGRIHTLDAAGTIGQAVAIRDGRVLSVGGDAPLLSLAAAHTRQIDLRGRTAIPGLFDSHNHLMEVGAKLSTIRLDECRSVEEMVELVRQRALGTPAGEWIVGQGWNEGYFSDG